MKNSAILLLICPDRKGLVAAISDFIFRHNGNILHADEHGDAESPAPPSSPQSSPDWTT